MGHRLERHVRNYLESQYGISRLPAIFHDGVAYTDFASAVGDASAIAYRAFQYQAEAVNYVIRGVDGPSNVCPVDNLDSPKEYVFFVYSG